MDFSQAPPEIAYVIDHPVLGTVPYDPRTHWILEQHEEDDFSLQDPSFEDGITRKIIIDSSDASCPICYEPYTDGQVEATLACGHHFHDDCLMRWLHKDRTCPMDRGKV